MFQHDRHLINVSSNRFEGRSGFQVYVCEREQTNERNVNEYSTKERTMEQSNKNLHF